MTINTDILSVIAKGFYYFYTFKSKAILRYNENKNLFEGLYKSQYTYLKSKKFKTIIIEQVLI